MILGKNLFLCGQHIYTFFWGETREWYKKRGDVLPLVFGANMCLLKASASFFYHVVTVHMQLEFFFTRSERIKINRVLC